MHRCTGAAQCLDEQVVLAGRPFEIWCPGESQLLPLAGDGLLIDEGIARVFDGDARQAIDLGQDSRHHFHRVRIVSRSKRRIATHMRPILTTNSPSAIQRITGPVSSMPPNI